MVVVQPGIFAGEGEMADLMRTRDWAATPLGPAGGWPPSLLTALNLILESRYPMMVIWGPDFIQFYNDAYRPILGSSKHPGALGAPCPSSWPEAWATIGPLFQSVRDTGQPVWYDDLLLDVDRDGYLEETHFAFSYSPIRDEAGGVGGVLVTCVETTAQVLSERRLRALRDLAARTATDRADHACAAAAAILADNPADVPFALIYLLDAELTQTRLAGLAGLSDAQAGPTVVDLGEDADGNGGWPLRHALEAGEAIVVGDLGDRFGALPGGSWPESPRVAVVLPLRQPGQPPLGLLVAGVSPRRALDDAYRGFLDLVGDQVASAIANAQTLEQERVRAAALAALDRAKTTFFSNVSHEFRTPLTLLLGPLEGLLHQPGSPLGERERLELETAHRNGLRLLRLVNALLDFSRIEAGRIDASYRPTDLATWTTEIASQFQSAIERAGLRFVVDCPPLPEPVYVDPAMWEKIVLNLLSNALKHTLHGEIEVRLRSHDGRAELSVRDTGVGIPAADLPHVFERFYRARSAEARSIEGSGIGLSLVEELVRLHGGAAHVESVEGEGAAFTVAIPFGKGHLPDDRIAPVGDAAAPPTTAAPVVEEASRWLPDVDVACEAIPADPSVGDGPPRDRSRILVIDDNADMRAYLQRVLEPRWAVETAADGASGLAAIRANPPDLILSDVMMPGLDGFALVRSLRSDPALHDRAVVLVSARAGEEAASDGLDEGADDYLIKPFTARELLARIDANLRVARMRQEAERDAERARLAIAVAGLGAWRYDPAADLVHVDERMAQICGEPGPGALALATVLERVHPDDRERVARTVASALAPESSGAYAIEFRIVRPDGTERWIATNGQARFAGEGGARRAIDLTGTVLDITDRRAVEDELRRRAGLLDQAEDAVFAWSIDGTIVYWNKGAERLYGYTAEEAVGRISHELLRTEHPGSRDAFLRALQTDETIEAELTQTRRDGARVTVATRHQMIREGDRRLVLEANRDITERKAIEAALQQGEERQAFLLKLSDALRPLADPDDVRREAMRLVGERLMVDRVLYAEVTPDGEFIELSDNYVRGDSPMLTGRLPIAEFGAAMHTLRAGTTLVIPDVDEGALDDAAKTSIRAAGVRAAIAVPFVKNGRWISNLGVHHGVPRAWTADEIHLLEDAAERTWAAVERARAEQALRESERRLQQLADAMPQIVWISAADGATITYLNRRWFDYTGQPSGAVGGRSSVEVAAAIHPEDRPRTMERWSAAVAAGTEFEAEARLRGADGRYRWILARCVPIRDDAGGITQWFGTSTDITALKQAEATVRRSEERLQRAIEIETVGVIFVRTDGAVTYANDAFLRMSGYDRDDLARGRVRWDIMTPPEWMPVTIEVFEGFSASGRITPYEKEYIRKDGSRWWALFAGTRLDDDEGVEFVLDITETKRMEAAHQAIIDAVAHDVKNPLTAVVGQAQLISRRLARGDDDFDRLKAGVAAIAAGATRAADLLDELTDAARLGTGQLLTLQSAPVDLVSLAETAARQHQSATDRHTIQVETTVASLVGDWDAARIRRVLDNLLGNAVKYSPNGGPVTVTIGREEESDDVWAVLTVADRGVGIPRRDLPRVFERFHRGGNVARRIAGSGIGLSGARQIVEQHGGSIAVASVEGQGSAFTVRLPLPADAG